MVTGPEFYYPDTFLSVAVFGAWFSHRWMSPHHVCLNRNHLKTSKFLISPCQCSEKKHIVRQVQPRPTPLCACKNKNWVLLQTCSAWNPQSLLRIFPTSFCRDVGYPYLEEASPSHVPRGVFFHPPKPINVNPISIYTGSEGRSCSLL